MTKKLEVTFSKEAENLEFYGYKEFVRKAINKCANKKEYGLTGKITIVEAEPSKRIYFNNELGEDFILRYFQQGETEKSWDVSYTLYKSIDNGDGSGHGEEISCGYTSIHYVYDAEIELKNS